MNTKDEWQTVARVHELERLAFCQAIFGRDEMPVVSLIPQMATLPGYDEPQMVYELDLKAVTDEQRQRLIDVLADKFDLSPELVADELDRHGVPILASDVSVSSCDRALVMGAIL